MQPFATFDAENKSSGFYFAAVHGDKMPVDAVEISDEDYQAYCTMQGEWLRDPVTGQRVAAPPPPPPTREELLVGIRDDRNRRLAACDWTQTPTARLTAEQLAAWNKYRDLLFDFPKSCNPADPIWPEVPKQ